MPTAMRNLHSITVRMDFFNSEKADFDTSRLKTYHSYAARSRYHNIYEHISAYIILNFMDASKKAIKIDCILISRL
jgi:hypothetical protein